MANELVRKPVSSPSRGPLTSLLATGLPPSLEALVRPRLQLMALVVMAISVTGVFGALVVLRALLPAGEVAGHSLTTLMPAMAVSFGVAVMVWALARWQRLGPVALGWLAVAFEAALGLNIGLGRHSVPAVASDYPHSISGLCVLIVLFPVIVPSTVRRALLAGMVTAGMEVLAFAWQTQAYDRPWPPMRVTATLLVPDFVFALMAVIPAWFVFHLGREVSRAEAWGSYQLEEKLGQGGMGEVWRARHHTLARPAAIKLIRPEMMGSTATHAESALVRFEREAQATARLRSPHAVELFDFGRTEAGAFFYVMELLDGYDLDTLVERFGPLPAPRAAFLLWQACDCLVDAHTAGLIHRDIKPANIYACRYGHRGDFVKVLDFGLVKLSHVDSASDVRLTLPGYLAGTPAYSPPEGATDPASIDARSDLYSLGCVAFWLLTGRLVFQADTPTKMLLEHVLATPPPPSLHTELPVPAELDALVLDLLAKDPKKRPQTASEVMTRLEQMPGWGSWRFDEGRQWWDRHAPKGTVPAPLAGSERDRLPKSVELAETAVQRPRVQKAD